MYFTTHINRMRLGGTYIRQNKHKEIGRGKCEASRPNE